MRQTVAKELGRESGETESQCMDRKETSIEDKDSKHRSGVKDKVRPCSTLEKHGGGRNNASSRVRGWSETLRKPYSNTRKKSELRTETGD